MNDLKRIIIVLLGLVLIATCAFGIKGHLDSSGYKNQVNYTTAIQSTEKDNFNYIVDSQQGRVLANGTFTAKADKLAKFDEMSQGFTYVKREKEHYTRHTSEDCSTDSEGNEHCTTDTYYTWDTVDTNESYANEVTFMGRDYPATLFSFSKYEHDTDACSFTAAGTGTGWLETKHGCIDGDFYLNDDDRYSYLTVPLSFNATFLATTFGGLKPFNENSITLQNKSIKDVLRDVGRYQLYSFWVVVFILIILTIGAIYVAFQWVMEDGMWSLER